MFNARRRASDEGERREPLVTYSVLPAEPSKAAAGGGDAARVEPRLRVVPSTEIVPVVQPGRALAVNGGGAVPPVAGDERILGAGAGRDRRKRGGPVFRLAMTVGLLAFVAGAGVLAATFVGVLKTDPLPGAVNAARTESPPVAGVLPAAPLSDPADVAGAPAPAGDVAALPSDTAPAAPADEGLPVADQTAAPADGAMPRPTLAPGAGDAAVAGYPATAVPPPPAATGDDTDTDPRFGVASVGPAMDGTSDADLLVARGRAEVAAAPTYVQPPTSGQSTGGTVQFASPQVPSVDDLGSGGWQRPFQDGTGAAEQAAPSPATAATALPPATMLPPGAGGTDDPSVMTPADGEVMPVPPADIPDTRPPSWQERLRLWLSRPRG